MYHVRELPCGLGLSNRPRRSHTDVSVSQSGNYLMYVRLTVKLAEVVEGVDLSNHNEGDVFELADHDAGLLIRGGWAERIEDEERVNAGPVWRSSIAADRP
jgi:hypothetical protein